MRIKTKINVRAWEDAEMKNVLFAPDDKLAEVTIDNMGVVTSGVLKVENDSNMSLPFGDLVSLRGVFLKSDQNILITLNSGDQESLESPSEGTDDDPTYCHYFFEGTITAFNIEKADSDPATDANVRYIVWGDPET